jgi:L-aminopeptidase/D-esterase-like protein
MESRWNEWNKKSVQEFDEKNSAQTWKTDTMEMGDVGGGGG